MTDKKLMLAGMAFVLLLSAAYLLIAGHKPFSLDATMPFDDTLFMELGRQIAAGHWLGEYDGRTLLKGPGYPLFLAGVSLSGLSLGVMQGLFHILACLAMAAVFWRPLRSWILAVVIFALLLWHPEVLNQERVLRDVFYTDLVLLLLASLFYGLFLVQRLWAVALWAVLSGLLLGWAWLTREEGVWLFPALVLLYGAALVKLPLSRVLVSFFLMMILFAGVLGGFRYGNWVHYNTWVGVDTKEASFKEVVSLLQGVKVGEPVPYVPVSAVVREKLYTVSPTLASVRDYLEPGRARWQSGCAHYPQSCGDIAAGWFPFALRGTAAYYGHHESPAKAAAFYGAIIKEVEAACRAEVLECGSSVLTQVPPMTREQWLAIPGIFWQGLGQIVAGVSGEVGKRASRGVPAQIESAREFLNQPPIRGTEPVLDKLTISGLYYDSKTPGAWFKAGVTNAMGQQEPQIITRFASPELRQRYGPEASQQRFVLQTDCTVVCIFKFSAADGSVYTIGLDKLIAAGGHRFRGERAALVIDQVRGVRVEGDNSPAVLRSLAVTDYLMGLYGRLMPGLTLAGAGAFLLACIVALLRRRLSTPWVIAASLWALAATRLVILTLLDASAFPGFFSGYVLPAWLVAAVAAPLSIFCLWRYVLDWRVESRESSS